MTKNCVLKHLAFIINLYESILIASNIKEKGGGRYVKFKSWISIAVLWSLIALGVGLMGEYVKFKWWICITGL